MSQRHAAPWPPLPRPALSALLALLATGPACRQAAPPPAEAPVARPATAPSRLADPTPVRCAPQTVATGTLKPRQQAALAMSVPGTLARVLVARGQEVAAGALLATLDDASAAAGRRQAEAAVAAARAQLALAEDGLGRVSAVHASQGSSEAQLVQARAQRDLATAGLAGAEAQLELARVHLDHQQLRAPFAGVVTRIPDGVGVAVAPGVPGVQRALLAVARPWHPARHDEPWSPPRLLGRHLLPPPGRHPPHSPPPARHLAAGGRRDRAR